MQRIREKVLIFFDVLECPMTAVKIDIPNSITDAEMKYT